MRDELQALFEQAGYTLPPDGDLLRHMIVTKNETTVPVSPLWPEPLIQRGFQALLLDEGGHPVRYARCADARIRAFERECRILNRLNADPRSHQLIPRSRNASSSRLRVQVAEYLPTTKDLRTSGALSLDNFLETTQSALVVRDELSTLGASCIPELLDDAPTVSLGERAGAALAHLREDPATVEDVEPVARLLHEAPAVHQNVQHGDFWPGNLILYRGSWRVIDFEDFARANLPLYDEFHFIQATSRMGVTGAGSGWLGVSPDRAPDPWLRMWRGLVEDRAAHHGVDLDTAGVLLAFYVVHMCAHRMRPGVGPVVSEDLRSDLHAIAEALRRGVRPRDLLPAA